MTFSEYILESAKTKSPFFLLPIDYNSSEMTKLVILDVVDSLHGAMGVCTEAGELMDAMKRLLFYKKPIDHINVQEEIGDLMWYIARICQAHGYVLEDVLDRNIRKLKARFPDKFTTERALNRDLNTERKVLENDFTGLSILKEKITESLDIAGFYALHNIFIELEGSELHWSKRTYCPFHDALQHTFKVKLSNGDFHCFACGERGSIFDFVQKRLGYTFKESICHLAKLAKVNIAEELERRTLE